MRHPVSSRRSSIKWNMSSEGGKVIVHSESYSGRTIHQNRYLILDLGREVGTLCASDLIGDWSADLKGPGPGPQRYGTAAQLELERLSTTMEYHFPIASNLTSRLVNVEGSRELPSPLALAGSFCIVMVVTHLATAGYIAWNALSGRWSKYALCKNPDRTNHPQLYVDGALNFLKDVTLILLPALTW